MKYTAMSETFQCAGLLDANMTLYELVTLIARNTTLTAEQIEKTLLDVVNDMLAVIDQ
jgi:hypothetical protein